MAEMNDIIFLQNIVLYVAYILLVLFETHIQHQSAIDT